MLKSIYEISSNLSSPRIIVQKKARTLELWDGELFVHSYPMGLGSNPIGHKTVEGDKRTPEGIYYVCTRNKQSKFYKALGVSYPNKEDAKTALDADIITTSIYESIATNIDLRIQPPWKTPMGGAIMIHGHGGNKDWTMGCIAVDNVIMDILWQCCPIGTPILIYP